MLTQLVNERGRRVLIGAAFALSTLLWGLPGGATDAPSPWRPVTAAFHVHGVTGNESFDTLAAQAKAAGIEAIFLTDNYLLRYEYGLFPFRGLIRRTHELPSVLQIGVDRFLAGVQEAGLRHPEVLFIPGVEVVPHYYWTGSLLSRDLTMHDSQKNVLVLGLPAADDYQRLPAAGNYAAYEYGWGTFLWLWPVLLIPPAIWLMNRWVDRKVKVGWTFMIVRSRRLAPAVALLVVAGLLLINNYPFGTPHYDTYSDGSGLRPHQDLIDYVRQRGGLTIWSMPEARDFNRFDFGRLGTVTVKTEPYPEALLTTSGYTGFGALYQDTITVTDPGGVWDAVLTAYAEGPRRDVLPPWGFGEIAYRGPDSGGKHLYQVDTVLLVKERTPSALLDAMAKGRMYARFRDKEYALVLDDFALVPESTGAAMISGQTLQVPPSSPVRVRIAVSTTDGRPHQTTVRVIRSGQVLSATTETLPFTLVLQDAAPAAGRTAYYRLMIGSRDHQIVTNPIFVRGQ